MPDTPGPDPTTLDRRFEEVVEQFLREREAGRTPDPQRYLLDFPELTSLLRDFFAGQDLFDRLAPDLAPQGQATALATCRALPALGERVGGFELLEEVGRGGMGVVYRARQATLDRVVALKMIRRGQADDPELARFRVEAEAIARLQHPNIVQVFEVGEHAGLPFVALEYCSAGSLAERLRGTTLRPVEAAAVVAALAQAMQAAHQHNVIHRDLKPANVLLAGGDTATPLDRLTPKVSDFGLARKLDDPGLTQSGVIMGTPSYMAPEQARGHSKEVGPAADVYALGAVLYECLTGRPPFQAATALETLAQVLDREPLPPRQLNPAVPRDLETVSLKCLRKEPQKRYADAQALADDLGRYLDGRPVQARRVGRAERLLKWVRRRPAAAGLAAALVLLAVVGLVVGWSQYQQRAEARGRQQQTDAEARTILARARDLLAEGWKATDEAKLKEAVTEGERAVVVARRGQGSTAVEQESSAFKKEAAERLQRWRNNDALCGALLGVSTPPELAAYTRSAGGMMRAVSQPSVDEQYAAAFRRWGLDVDATAESRVVARLRAQPDAVVQNVIAALDSWARERQRRKRQVKDWQRLRGIADELDDSPTRRRLRRLLLEGVPPQADAMASLIGVGSPWTACWELAGGKDWRHVQELRGRMNLAKEPVLTVALLARASYAAGDEAGAAEILREAGAARPEQLVLLHELALLLDEQQRWEEAIGCYRALRVRRPDLGIALGLALVRVGRGWEGERVLHDLLRQKPDNPEAHYNLGIILGEQRKDVEAEVAYRQAIKLKRDFPQAHNNLGMALQHQGRLVEAQATYRQAIKLRPDLTQAHNNLGIILAGKGKYAEAAASYREAIKHDRDDPIAYTNLGNLLSKQKRHKEAEAALRLAIALRPDHVVAYLHLGNALSGQRRYAEAEAAYHNAIKLKPDLPQAHRNLGALLLGQKRLTEAEAASRQAIALKADYAEAYIDLAIALTNQKRLPEAEAACRQAIKFKPKNADAYFNLGPILSRRGNHAEAEAVCRKAIELNPYDAQAYFNLGVFLTRQKKHAEAERAYRQAIKLQFDLPGTHFRLGYALADQGRYREAEAEYQQAIALKQNLFEAYLELGVVRARQGKSADAEAAYRQAVAQRPNAPQAHMGLGSALGDQRKYVEAEAAFRQAIRLRPDYGEAYFNLGIALLAQGKPVEAEEAYCKALALGMMDAEVYSDLGVALARQQKYARAVLEFRRAIALKPKYAEAYDNLGVALKNLGHYLEAEAAYRTAMKIKPTLPEPYYNLGVVLGIQGKLAEAEAAFHQAIKLKPDDPQAYLKLGNLVMQQARFNEALAVLKKGGTLLSARDPRRQGWQQLMRQCQRFQALDARLPAVLQGPEKPASPAEQLEFAHLCTLKHLYAAAARFCRTAFAAEPRLADAETSNNRYNAACCAALAGCGRGKDADRLDVKERAVWREQAREWLRADLTWWSNLLDAKPRAGPAIRQALQGWQTDPDFAGVRDADALAKLPDPERAEWQKLWQEVETLRRRAGGSK
jgi:Flp pilus assembly protein TadD